MRKIVLCIIAALALSFSAQQAQAQNLVEGRCYLEVNGDMTERYWHVNLPTRYSTVDIKIRALKVINGALTEIPWEASNTMAPELNKTKVNSTTLRISLKDLSTPNTFVALGIVVEGRLWDEHIGVFFPAR